MAQRLCPIGATPSPGQQRRDVRGLDGRGPEVTFALLAGAHGAASPDHADPERSDAVLALEIDEERLAGTYLGMAT
jgi:hypothetical protein